MSKSSAHQELFRRIEQLAAAGMPPGYTVAADPNDVARTEVEATAIHDGILKAYRWQYIVSGIQDGRFLGVLTGMITEAQATRITTALGPLM